MIKNKLEYIVGYPSGEILNLTTPDMYFLSIEDIIMWKTDIGDFVFDDKDLNKIINILKKIKLNDYVKVKNTNKVGKINLIVKNYQGEKIYNKDVSKLFKKGDCLYIVEFENHKTGIYLLEQMDKLFIRNNIFVDND